MTAMTARKALDVLRDAAESATNHGLIAESAELYDAIAVLRRSIPAPAPDPTGEDAKVVTISYFVEVSRGLTADGALGAFHQMILDERERSATPIAERAAVFRELRIADPVPWIIYLGTTPGPLDEGVV